MKIIEPRDNGLPPIELSFEGVQSKITSTTKHVVLVSEEGCVVAYGLDHPEDRDSLIAFLNYEQIPYTIVGEFTKVS